MAPTKSSRPRKHSGHSIRIISGRWRGRKLPVADLQGLRPTGDRIRETLFNWLQGKLTDARVLDLFSGSGALALEALSRGASNAWLVEQQAVAARQISSNLATLNAANGKVLHIDALSLLAGAPPSQGFNIVFVDPPFSNNLWQSVLELLVKPGWLANDALIYIEYPGNTNINLPPPLRWHRQATAGAVAYGLACLQPEGLAGKD